MAKNATAVLSKNDLRLEVKNQLEQSLQPWKELLGEKKFNKKIKNAAKHFSKGLKKEKAADATEEKATAKKEKHHKKPEATEAVVPVAEPVEKKQPAKKAASKKVTAS